MIAPNRFGVLECDRNSEFAPVKNSNKDLIDCPAIACKMLLDECGSWMSQTPQKITNIEISPLLSYQGEGLANIQQTYLKHPQLFTYGGYFDHYSIFKESPHSGIDSTPKDERSNCCMLF